MAFGLLPTGFVRKTTADILDELRTAQLEEIDPELNTQPETPIGQLNGIFAAKLNELWELAAAVYSAQNPDTASDFSLDGVSALTGTNRAPATKGTVTLTVNIDPGTLPAGSIAEVDGDPTNRWVTTEDVTNGGGGAADFDVEAEAENAGNIAANAGTITKISTPVIGWNTVTNALDADPGTEIDTDAQLRVRREAELSQAGTGTLPAIRADLLGVDDVEAVSVFHNPTDYQVGNLPPHSVEAVVLGGDDQDILDQLFESVGAGIQTYGTTTGTVNDGQGNTLDFAFSRPTDVDIWLEIDINVNTNDYPADGDTLIETAVKAYGDANYRMGDDVVLSLLYCPINSAVAGIEDITEIRVGDSSPPVSTSNWPIGPRELARLDTTRITVTATPV